MFERLTVGIGINPEKTPLFTPQERLELLAAGASAASAERHGGLLRSASRASFVRRCGAAVMLRGLRTLTDIESEFSMTLANRALAIDLETVFLMASEKYSHISSSLIKQVALLGTDSANRTARSIRSARGHWPAPGRSTSVGRVGLTGGPPEPLPESRKR